MRPAVCIAVACLALLVVPAAGAKRVSVTFAGSGSETATVANTFTTSPTCQIRTNIAFQAQGLTWRVRWNRVPVPRGRRAVSRNAVATLTGTSSFRSEETMSGCPKPREPSRDCTVPLALSVPAILTVRRKGRGVRVTAEFLGSAGDGDEEFAADSEECPTSLRLPAIASSVRLRRTASRTQVNRVNAAMNAAASNVEWRPHFETTQHETDFTSHYVSDVDWAGVMTLRPRGR